MTDNTPSEQATDPAARWEKRGHIVIVTLNRPRVMNAVNTALSAAAGEALERAQADPEVRAIVITGAGRGFCAGADLKELAAELGRDLLPALLVEVEDHATSTARAEGACRCEPDARRATGDDG